MADTRVQQSTNRWGYRPKALKEDDIKYWWNVLGGKKLVKASEYKFDPEVVNFTEEHLPKPIRVLKSDEEKPDGEKDWSRYTLWIDEKRVCVKLEIG